MSVVHNLTMEHPPGHGRDRASPTPREPGADSRLKNQVMLAEYSSLRAEIERRTSIQWNVVALQIGSAGTIASLAISAVSNIALLLVIPLTSYMLGSRYILHDYHIKLIHRYIASSLSSRLGNALEWERWKDTESAPAVDKDQWLTPTGWNPLHPTWLVFGGVATGALIAAAVAAVYYWSTASPRGYYMVGFAVCWALDVVAVSALHRSLQRAASHGQASQRSA